MNILFFITENGNGRGGHYHSLDHISRELGKCNNVKIISIGSGKTGAIGLNPYFYKHIKFNGLNFLKLKKEIIVLKENFNPDIYHCFDSSSYNIIRLIVSSRTEKIVLNKCGGRNPKHYPHAYNIILFSLENYNWFKDNTKYFNSLIYLIPNRVHKVDLNQSNSFLQKKVNDFVFVRICRIGQMYKKSILDSINLINELYDKNISNVKLYIIGTIIEESVYEEIVNDKAVIDKRVFFITDDKYTLQASKMLYIADAVIGTGRGIMEAASLNLPILAINEEGRIPVLINEENFMDAFKTNFSERNLFQNDIVSKNIENIIRLVKDKYYYKQLSEFSGYIFDKYFEVSKVSTAYKNVYINTKKGKRYILKDSYIIIYFILYFFRCSIKNRSK